MALVVPVRASSCVSNSGAGLSSSWQETRPMRVRALGCVSNLGAVAAALERRFGDQGPCFRFLRGPHRGGGEAPQLLSLALSGTGWIVRGERQF